MVIPPLGPYEYEESERLAAQRELEDRIRERFEEAPSCAYCRAMEADIRRLERELVAARLLLQKLSTKTTS